jgi:hypothetical protein
MWKGKKEKMKRPQFLSSLILTLLILVAQIHTGYSQVALYGTTKRGGVPSDLVRLDPKTEALIEHVGPIGYSVNGLTWDPTTNTMFGSTSVMDENHNGLITIDLQTGTGTPIGSGWDAAVNSIEARADGDIFGWWNPVEHALVSVNKQNGTFLQIGNSGLDTVRIGLAFDNDGILYLANGLDFRNYIVDTNTGDVEFVSQFQSIAHHGDINPADNLYYAIDTSGDGPKNIVIGDLATGGFFLDILPTVDDLHTLTFVPEPSSAVLAVCVVTAVFGRRRRFS